MMRLVGSPDMDMLFDLDKMEDFSLLSLPCTEDPKMISTSTCTGYRCN